MAAATSLKLASDLKKFEKRALELQAESDRIAAALGQAAAIRDKAADAELCNDLAAASRSRAEAAKLENSTRAREGELASLVPRLEALIASTKSDIERAIFEETLAARDAKAAKTAKLARSIASDLKGPLADASRLSELRAEIDDLDTQARELAKPLGAEVEPIEDEPAFGDPTAIDVIAVGARQPTATAVVAEELRAADAAANRESWIETAVRDEVRGFFPPKTFDGSRMRGPIERLDEDLQPEAIKRFASAVKRVPEQVRPSREHRLVELRELLTKPTEEVGGETEAEQGGDPLPLVAA